MGILNFWLNSASWASELNTDSCGLHLSKEGSFVELYRSEFTTAINGVRVDPRVNDDILSSYREKVYQDPSSLGTVIEHAIREVRKDPFFALVPNLELVRLVSEGLKVKPDGTSGGAFLIREIFRETLRQNGIDPNARPGSFAAVAEKFGYRTLQHWTNFERAVEILSAGEIKLSGDAPRNGILSNESAIYLQLSSPVDHKVDHLVNTLQEVALRSQYQPSADDDYHSQHVQNTVTFFFPVSRLDSDRWIRASPSWIHGRDTVLSAGPTNMFMLVLQLGYGNNEILFSDSFKIFSTPFFVATDHETRENLVAQLNRRNVSPPMNHKWVDLIRVFRQGNSYDQVLPIIKLPEVFQYNFRYAPLPD